MSGPSDPVRIVDILPGVSIAIGAGGEFIGLVGGLGDAIFQTPTITAGAYATGDAVGGLLEFADAVRESGGMGRIETVIVIDDAKQEAELELWLFDRTFTPTADNAPWDPSDADMQHYIGTIAITNDKYFAGADNAGATVRNVGMKFKAYATSIFGQHVVRGTPTYTATDDLTTGIVVDQD